MIIDIHSNVGKRRARTAQERRQLVFLKRFYKAILPILKKQYRDAADNIESYEFNFNYAIEKYNKDLRNIYRVNYQRILKEFGENLFKVFSEGKTYIKYESKSFIDDFWRYAIPWMNINTATKVTQINETTKKRINLIVKKGMRTDSTNKEIADKIKQIAEISLPFRAQRIARTETHSAANWATDKAMDSSRMMKEKEWISALDERTRTIGKGADFDHVAANGERVAMDDTFKGTGENLRYPGDYENGSPGNIINCRCQALYFTNVQVRRSGE
jgi:hypothetical protein